MSRTTQDQATAATADPLNITRELAQLQRLGMTELRSRYAEAFGEKSRSGNRQFLIKRILWRLQSQAEGTLSERAVQRARAIADEAYLRTTMPRREPAPLAATANLVTTTAGTGRMNDGAGPDPTEQSIEGRLDRSSRRGLPMSGTTLTRQYKGRLIRVTVLTDGFEYEGERYRSLTAVAKAVTGAHWNGRYFFGVAGSAS